MRVWFGAFNSFSSICFNQFFSIFLNLFALFHFLGPVFYLVFFCLHGKPLSYPVFMYQKDKRKLSWIYIFILFRCFNYGRPCTGNMVELFYMDNRSTIDLCTTIIDDSKCVYKWGDRIKWNLGVLFILPWSSFHLTWKTEYNFNINKKIFSEHKCVSLLYIFRYCHDLRLFECRGRV